MTMKITVDTPDGFQEMEGKCLESKLIWAENVEHRYHINNGVYATKQVPTEHSIEIWEMNGEKIKLSKFETAKGTRYVLTMNKDVQNG